MALIFAAEIGDLEQVKSLVLSCEDRAIAINQSNARNSANEETNSEDESGIEGDSKSFPETNSTNFEKAKLELVNTAEPKKGKTALIAAISQGHYAVSHYLLETGSDPSTQTLDGSDSLMLACSLHGKKANHHDLVRLLLDHEARVSNRDRRGDTALHYACRKGCNRSVRHIAATPMVDINAQNAQGLTPLMASCFKGYLPIVETLCSLNVDVTKADSNGNTALHYAARSGKETLVGPLKVSHCDLEAQNMNGLTAFKIAAALGHATFVQELLLSGADVERWSKTQEAQHIEWGETFQNPRSAIILASSNGHIETLQILLSHQLKRQNEDSLSSFLLELKEAARVAVINCQEEVYRFLFSVSQLILLDEAKEGGLGRKALRALKYRKRCTCFDCNSYYDDDPSVPSASTGSNGSGSLSSTLHVKASDELVRESSDIGVDLQSCDEDDLKLGKLPNDLPSRMGLESRSSSLSVVSTISVPFPSPSEGAKHSLLVGKKQSPSLVPALMPSLPVDSDIKIASENARETPNVPRRASTSKLPVHAPTASTSGIQTSNNSGNVASSTANQDGSTNKRLFREKCFDPLKVLDAEDPGVKNDILRIIGTYLQSEGYTGASLILQDEAQIKLTKRSEMHDKAQNIHDLISQGEWTSISKFNTKAILGRNNRRFLYALHKQEYLELISRGENERAFAFLHKKLKPLEAQSKAQGNANEFADLCYLLTCKSVHDAPSFRNWDATSARDKLAEDFKTMVISEFSTTEESSLLLRSTFVEKDRLVHLLQQAVAYQLEFSSAAKSGVTPRIETLLEDFQSIAIPSVLSNTFVGHSHNVKCVEFLGEDGRLLASGSSDRTIRIWKVQDDVHSDQSSDGGSESGSDDQLEEDELSAESIHERVRNRFRLARKEHSNTPLNMPDRLRKDSSNSSRGLSRRQDAAFLKDHRVEWETFRQQKNIHRRMNQRGPELTIRGHKSRIWDLASDRSGRWLCSASGDNTVRMWDVWSCLQEYENSRQLGHAQGHQHTAHEVIETGHEGDIYAVGFHYDQSHLVSAGYDKTVRLVNLRTNQVVKAFHGHTSAVTHAKFNPFGNLIISASKDSTIKFWDTVSGVCIRTFYQPVGEVTSVDVSRDGLQILSSSKDSSVRLWDVRTGRSMRRFRGYQNSSLNFVRAVFGPLEALVFSGSEDGKVHAWDTQSGNLLAKLRGHSGPVFHTAWNNSQSMLASCSEDGTVRTWRA